MGHVNYPHNAGDLYDCPPCEMLMLRESFGERTRAGTAIIRDLIRIDNGDGDSWGTAMSYAFATGEILAVGDHDAELYWIFSQQEFRPSPVLRSWADLQDDAEDWPRSLLVADVDAGRVTFADVLYWFRVSCRYADVLRAAGRDY